MIKEFENQSLISRLKSMLKVDVKRLVSSPIFYITLGIALVMPVLILVMTTMMDGMTTVDQQTGAVTVIQGFDNVWQIIGTVSGAQVSAEMGLTTMCNINLLYFLACVLVCIFVAEDFRSGYAKNLFTVRAKKSDYVISKLIVGFLSTALMFIAFLIGTFIGGKIAGLPFNMQGFSVLNLVFCMICKIFIGAIFVSMFLLAGVFAKTKLWLSILISLGFSALFFIMVPMMSPLNADIINLLLCAVGSVFFGVGITFASKVVLDKTNIV